MTDGPLRGHDAPLNYHRLMLEDPHRMDAYERAIRALVRPGDVVLDVGTGTGILAMLAARRGAARVHGVESMPVARVARELVAHNGLADTVRIHEADLTTLEPIEPVDLVIGDFLGRFLVDDHMIDAVAAAARWLKPGGRICPAQVHLKVAAVGNMTFGAIDLFWDGIYGLDFSPVLPYTHNHCYRAELSPDVVLGPAVDYLTFAPPEPCPAFDTSIALSITKGGLLRGIAGWFEADMAPGITLQNGPGVETHWGQHLFPLPEVQVSPGDRLSAHVRLVDDIWRWQGALTRGNETILEFELEGRQWKTDQG